MTKIKLCGLSRPCDIETVNTLNPDYIGFVFAKKSKRYVSPETAASLKASLNKSIKSVGVFVNEPIEKVAELLNNGTINVAQLHGSEDETYISELRKQTSEPIWKAFRIDSEQDIEAAKRSSADCILVDSGNGGTGTTFDWSLLEKLNRPYFLAGGLNVDNVEDAVRSLQPYGVDVSSGIETDCVKDPQKMSAFMAGVRKGETV